MQLTDVIKIIWFSLFFSIAIGGIFRETGYFYQTPNQYYSDTGEKQEITKQRYEKAQGSSYEMYYSMDRTFNESLAFRAFFLLIILSFVTVIIVNSRR